MGFLGLALATTFIGDVTLPLATGLATLKGKSLDPFFHGAVVSSSAGGAGRGLLWGDHVIGSGGMDGKFGCVGAVGGVCFVEELVPQELRNEIPLSKKANIVSPAHAMRPGDVTATLISLTSMNFSHTNRQPKSGGETGGYNVAGYSYLHDILAVRRGGEQ